MDVESRYELLEKVGSGSFATVYRARDLELGREIAVKQIHQQYLEDDKLLDRYWQEAQLLASLHHPNIVTIFDIYRDRGWLIMELMQSNLSERMADRQMDLRALRTTIAHSLRALKYLHSRGIIHGDIKPANLMIDARRRIKIGDFGLARRVSDDEGSLLKGTTKYMAPEVVSDEFGEVGPASDLYSLGFSAYDLMCGPNFETLFPGLSAFGRNKQVAWMMWHAATDRKLPPIERVLEGVPKDLATVIQKLCEKDPSKRYRSADEALSDLNIDLKMVKSGDGIESAADGEAGAESAFHDKKRLMLIAGAFAMSLVMSLVMLFMPDGDSGETAPKAQVWRVLEVYEDKNEIKVENLAGDRAELLDVGKSPRISLETAGATENAVLRELKTGDRIEVERTAEDGTERLVIRASRPVTSSGTVKSFDLQSRQVVVLLDEGTTRDELPLHVPERAVISVNGKEARLISVKVDDHVEVSHLDAFGDKDGRTAEKLAILRQVEAAGFVSAIDLKKRLLTIRFGKSEDTSSVELPCSEDCKVTLQGDSGSEADSIQLSDLRKDDRVKFSYDVMFREITVIRDELQLSGVLQHVDADSGEIIVATAEGKRLSFQVKQEGDVRLSQRTASVGDLRQYDKVDVTYGESKDGLLAGSILANRPVKNDRWAIIIANQDYTDGFLTTLRYSLRNANLFKQSLTERYAFSPNRVLLLQDESRDAIQTKVADWLNKAGSQTQVVVYVTGHAYVADNDRTYLAGKDFRFDDMTSTGVELNWLTREMENCASKSKMLLLDCSHSGTGKDLKRQPSSAEMLGFLKQTPLRSLAVIAGCSKDQRGLVLKDEQVGLFAHFLAEGFDGPADRDRDLQITAEELYRFLRTRMPGRTVAGKSQTPVLFSPKR